MTSQTIDNGYTRLLCRVAAHIGMSCFLYIDFLFSQRSLTRFELDVLSRIFTDYAYSDTVVDRACHVAHSRESTSVISLLSLVQTADFPDWVDGVDDIPD